MKPSFKEINKKAVLYLPALVTCTLLSSFYSIYQGMASHKGDDCIAIEYFNELFYEKYPSLEGKSFAMGTPVCNLFVVSSDGSSAFFDSKVNITISGEMAYLLPNGQNPIPILGNRTSSSISSLDSNSHLQEVEKSNGASVSRSNYEHKKTVEIQKKSSPKVSDHDDKKNVNTTNNSPPQSPNKYVGITKREINSDLKTLDYTVLPIFHADPDVGKVGAILTYVDITCSACKRYVLNIAKLNLLGFDVYLAPFPRSGWDSVISRRMVNLWCSNAMNSNAETDQILASFKGINVTAQTCKDEKIVSKLRSFSDFGVKHLNKTTPVSFTSNSVTVIANQEPSMFLEAVEFGNKLADFYVK
jgi:hypothetical protein